MARRQHIIFRVDSSTVIGTGHIMRCLTLADAIREHGGTSTFICRDHEGNLADLVSERGFAVHRLPIMEEWQVSGTAELDKTTNYPSWLGGDWNDDVRQTCALIGEDKVDWVVVDHYAIDYRWEQSVQLCCERLMVIDDLADRRHDCDVLLDQNLGRTRADYAGLLPDGTVALIGPKYALLRPEFARLRTDSLARRAVPKLEHLLVTMGGVDKDNATGNVLSALNETDLPNDLKISVVMGLRAPWLQQVQAQAARMNYATEVLVGVSDMARLMSECDLAIGAAGGTAWERCCLGLPSILIVLADNQHAGAMALNEVGAVVVLQHNADLARELQPFLYVDQISRLQQGMASAASAITDGQGAELVVLEMTKLNA